MLKYVIRRLIYSIPVVLLATILVFYVVHTSVDPSISFRFNPRTRPADILKFKHDLGLDKSGVQQYLTWLVHFFTGRWGDSLISSRAVAPQIKTALWNTVQLGVFATSISLFIGLCIGIYSAVKQ